MRTRAGVDFSPERESINSQSGFAATQRNSTLPITSTHVERLDPIHLSASLAMRKCRF